VNEKIMMQLRRKRICLLKTPSLLSLPLGEGEGRMEVKQKDYKKKRGGLPLLSEKK